MRAGTAEVSPSLPILRKAFTVDKPLRRAIVHLCALGHGDLLLDGRKVPLYGEGRNERDWLHVDDHCAALHLLVDEGGPGEIYINRVMMRVYTSDTEYKEYVMSHGSKPIPGDEIVVPGTRSGDRCEVFVISAGSRYKVIDERVYGGMYY